MSQRVLLMSVMAAMIAIPMIAARDRVAARGQRRTRIAFALFVVLWAFSLVHVLPMLKD